MLGGFLILAVIVFGFSIMLGVKVEKFYKLLLWLVFAPLLIDAAYCGFIWTWQSAPLWMQILSVLLLPFFISALLKRIFPKAKWLQALQAVIFHTLIYTVTFPFRFLWRAGKFLLQRERQTIRLNPYHPVVGGRVPLQNERREANPRDNIFD